MYIKLCDARILNVDEPRSFKIGNFFCLDARCTHAGAPLAEGTLNAQFLTCPWHYSQFDITTGAVLRGPAKKTLKVYGNEIRENFLYVNLEK